MRPRVLAALSAVLLVLMLASLASFARGNVSCDSYGDCLGSSVDFVRANPDNSLYPGDEFTVALSPVLGPSVVSSSVSWIYDSTAFSAQTSRTGGDFTLEENVTSATNFTMTAQMNLVLKLCANCTLTSSVVKTSVGVTAIPLVLQLTPSIIQNVTWHGYTLRNPDGSFFPYDQFRMTWNASFKFSDVRSDIKIVVSPIVPGAITPQLESNSSDPLGRYGAYLFSVGNQSSYSNPYRVEFKAAALNWEGTSLSVSVKGNPVNVTAFASTFTTRLVNVTDAYGNVMRNPDGSFYRNDTLCLSWNASFPFQNFRGDIRWNVTSLGSPSLRLLNASSWSSIALARDCFSVKLDAPFRGGNSITFSAHAYAWTNDSLSNQTSSQPFAVVMYDPSFTYMTYTDYNSNASQSILGRPFVTLVRYDWNNPGYDYPGDSNTGPITASKDLGERAWINNFTFASEGWRLVTDFGGSSVASVVSFANTTANLGLASTNETQKTILPNAVERYFFVSSPTKMAGYVANGLEYFNATVGFRSTDFAGGDFGLFNTTYLYEPILLSGTLTFDVYSGAAPDTQANVTLVVHNQVPLDQVLIANVLSRFGNDSSVIQAFKQDLYPADNVTQLLKPASVSKGVWTYIVNQTNWGSVNSAQMPQLTITVSSGTRSFSYTIPEAMSLFQIDGPPVFATTPFGNITGYYLDQNSQLLMLPINSTFAGSMPYLVWGFGASGSSSSPIAGAPPYFSSTEPGNLSKTYPFIFGQSNTVNVNLAGGGGVYVFPGGQVSDGMRTIEVLANDTSGGIVSVVADVDGRQISLTGAMQPNASPLAPLGFFGIQYLEFPADYNGTVSFQVTNSWGATWTLGSQTVTYSSPAFPMVPVELLSFFALFLVGLSLLAERMKVRRS